MKGTQHVEVSNRNAKFRFDLHRNITIVRGDSGTGKTTLYNMIADYTRLQAESGVNLSSTKPCVALMDMDWKNQLDGISNSIVFIDEGATYISSEKFAEAIKNSDNYYVIFNREGLHQLLYSVEEIIRLKPAVNIIASSKFINRKNCIAIRNFRNQNEKIFKCCLRKIRILVINSSALILKGQVCIAQLRALIQLFLSG